MIQPSALDDWGSERIQTMENAAEIRKQVEYKRD